MGDGPMTPDSLNTGSLKLESLKISLVDGIARITLAQPERGNPLDAALCRDLRKAAEECAGRAEVRAVLLDAEGRYFSVGGDLKLLTRDRDALPSLVAGMMADLNAAMLALAELDAPVVACVHGLAAGGAVGLLAGADFVLAGPEVRFVAAFAGIGITGDTGSSYYLPRRVGMRWASEFLLLNQSWDAQQAFERGLVNRVLPADALAGEAMRLARTLADGPTRGHGETRRLLGHSLSSTLDVQLAREAAAIGRLLRTDDSWDAMQAVLAKRPAVFRGR